MTVVAKFEISFTQYLDEHGKAIAELPEFAQDQELMCDIYKTMILTRTFDSKAIKLQRTGKMGTYASSLGQEAIAAAYGKAMAADDVLVPYYREYAAQLQRGASIADIYRYWGGNELGNQFGETQADYPFCVPIASQALHAVGIAKAIQYRKQKRAVVALVGDGATSEGDFYEALNVAGAWNLPVVFIINNNQWAISVARDVQTSCETLAQKSIAGGFEGVQVDGNDIVAMYAAADHALNKARNGEGPSLIEAITFRLCDHTTADDAGRYVPKEDMQRAWELEPLIRTRAYLTAQGWWDDAKEQAWQAECKQTLDQAVAEYENTPKQDPSSIFDYMYANIPKDLQEQKQELLDALGSNK